MSILRRKKSASSPDPLNPVAFAVRLIAKIITPLDDLEDDDKAFAGDEITWLFHAVKNFGEVSQIVAGQQAQAQDRINQEIKAEEQALVQKIGSAGRFTMGKKKRLQEERLEALKPQLWQEAIKNSPPVGVSVPEDTERLAGANNKILDGLSTFALEGFDRDLKANLSYIDTNFKQLERLLDREVALGEEGQRNIALQSQIKSRRVNVLKDTQKIANTVAQAYGVEITSPGQLADWLESS